MRQLCVDVANRGISRFAISPIKDVNLNPTSSVNDVDSLNLLNEKEQPRSTAFQPGQQQAESRHSRVGLWSATVYPKLCLGQPARNVYYCFFINHFEQYLINDIALITNI